MFLVRIEYGKKPRVYRLDPREATSHHSDARGAFYRRRSPRAWLIRPAFPTSCAAIGVAAVAETVDDGYRLIGALRSELSAAQQPE